MGDTRDRVGNAGVIVAGGAFKIALYVCIVVLIIWLGRLSYQFGHDIFDQQPMSPGEFCTGPSFTPGQLYQLAA